jgi:hypothetical protein
VRVRAHREPTGECTVSADNEKFWYNLETGAVERGFESPAIDRAGPFDTAEEAARAPEILRERSKAWAEDDARDADWGSDGAQR